MNPTTILGYFASNRSHLNVDGFETRVGTYYSLRTAQIGAYWAVRSHFTVSHNPALVVMPTGSGKTATMTLVAFGLGCRRLLIVVPAQVIREQVKREFERLKVARETGCIPSDVPGPKVKEVKRQLKNSKMWHELEVYDVIVATPKCVSPGEKNVVVPTSNMFDAIFFDEAHHLPARTWRSIAEHFSKARIVTFTATPYRNDKRPLPGDIVYNYPLAKAIEEGIYRRIQFIPVSGLGDSNAKNLRLAEKAKEVLTNEPPPAKLLVRVGSIAGTVPIKALYQSLGLRLEIVTSRQSIEENEAAINNVRNKSEYHGLIAVGMLGEGLDLPELRVAVMHAPHQSFPVTLQFIGRICRISSIAECAAKLIAIPDDIEEHTRGLYESDADWVSLLPKLADAATANEKARRRFSDERWQPHARHISVHTLHPFYSVTVYELDQPEAIDMTGDPSSHLRDSTLVFQSELSKDEKWRILILETRKKPIWSKSDFLLERRYDLLVYYVEGNFLFEYSTAPCFALEVRRCFSKGTGIRRVPGELIEQVLSGSGTMSSYFVVGMRRTSFANSRIPQYKMMSGRDAQNAIRLSDGEFFSVGHVFGRTDWYGSELVMGLSSNNSKVWAMKRSHMKEFTEWCDHLAQSLIGRTDKNLPFLGHLRRPIKATTFKNRPYFVDFSETFYEQLQGEVYLEIKDPNGEIREIPGHELALTVDDAAWSENDQSYCRVCLEADETDISLIFSLSEDEESRLEIDLAPHSAAQMKVREGGQRVRPYELADYFRDHPPVIYMINGDVIVGSRLFKYAYSSVSLPDEVFMRYDWEKLNCNIKVEDHEPLKPRNLNKLRAANQLSVLEATEHLLVSKIFTPRDIVIKDHANNDEIADYLVLQRDASNITLHLFHCKASKKQTPGVRGDDAYKVLGQARKSSRWVRRAELFSELHRRMENIGANKNLLAKFERAVDGLSPQTINYAVYVIQPGFDVDQLTGMSTRKDDDLKSVRLLIKTVYESFVNDGIEFKVIGSGMSPKSG